MPLKEIRPMLYTDQVGPTIVFYTSRLGFSCVAGGEEEGWAALRRDDIEIDLSRPNAHIPFSAPQFTGSFYIITEDVDTLWAELKDKARVCYPLESFEYGMREFAIYDNNGYLLQFGQELPD